MSIVQKLIRTLLVATLLVALYVAWTHATDAGNLAVISVTALLVSLLFVGPGKVPAITPKKIGYAVIYLGYMVVAIVRSTLDVAGRVLRPVIPLNPGIVKVRTRLKSKAGRMILANSITLTPGTLSVDVHDDYYYIHWIDITALDVEGASREIVVGFEKYLEVLFG